jgi:hypothetical protein
LHSQNFKLTSICRKLLRNFLLRLRMNNIFFFHFSGSLHILDMLNPSSNVAVRSRYQQIRSGGVMPVKLSNSGATLPISHTGNGRRYGIRKSVLHLQRLIKSLFHRCRQDLFIFDLKSNQSLDLLFLPASIRSIPPGLHFALLLLLLLLGSL